MLFGLSALAIFWLGWTTKIALFYIYLWQLKEYQVKRFLDHFRTDKGKQLVLNKLNLAKVFLIVIFFFHAPTFFGLLLVLYLLEFLKLISDIYKRRLKIPVLTNKTILLVSAAIFLEFTFLYFLFAELRIISWFPFLLLIFDILAPIIFSFLILIFQPLTVLAKYQIIRKAKKKREHFKNLLVIGITGSYGKTSAKEFLATILSRRFNVLKTKAHQNSEIGISQCILNELKESHQIFVVEMGAYGKSGIKLLADIIKPKIGILTGINEQHMATFGSQENIIKTKYELIESLPEEGTAIFNGDNEYCLGLYKKTQKIKKPVNNFLANTKSTAIADIFGSDITVEKEFISFKAHSKDSDLADFKVNLLGAHNVENLLLASLCAKKLGMNLAEISEACLAIEPEQGAMKFLRKEGPTILDASYSANLKGVIADLDYLEIYSGKKIIIIMPCLIELGKASKEVHKKIGRKIAEVCDLAIITTRERIEDIRAGAYEGGMSEENVLFLENLKEIADKTKYIPARDSVVLLEGRLSKEVIDWFASPK